eukprot:4926738-Pleurochrysis_carterae.AAC.1
MVAERRSSAVCARTATADSAARMEYLCAQEERQHQHQDIKPACTSSNAFRNCAGYIQPSN